MSQFKVSRFIDTVLWTRSSINFVFYHLRALRVLRGEKSGVRHTLGDAQGVPHNSINVF